MKKIILSLLLAVSVAACAETPAPPPPPQQLGQVNFNVSNIRVIDQTYAQPKSAPYITQQFTPTVGQILQQWLTASLNSTGQDGELTVFIRDASLLEMPIAREEGLNNLFYRQQARQYIARVEITLQASSLYNGRAYVSANAVKSVTLPENPTEEEKSYAYRKVLNNVMQEFDRVAHNAIWQHMGAFIAQPVAAPLPQVSPTVGSPGTQPYGQPMPQSMMDAPDVNTAAQPANAGQNQYGVSTVYAQPPTVYGQPMPQPYPVQPNAQLNMPENAPLNIYPASNANPNMAGQNAVGQYPMGQNVAPVPPAPPMAPAAGWQGNGTMQQPYPNPNAYPPYGQ